MKQILPERAPWLVVVLALCTVGLIGFAASRASTPTSSQEAEGGTLSSCASQISDASASAGSAVKFASCSDNPSAGAGANLPISYSLSSLTGQVLYVAPNGSDSGNGTVSSPFATLSHAVSEADSGATIVLRGGMYHEGNIIINKSLTVVAYPGETPKFNGSVDVPSDSGWTASGDLSYRSYTPMPVTSGYGIDFPDCKNQPSTDCVGRYPDQVWVGPSQYQQVYAQSDVTSGKFWVDHTNDRLYMLTSDLSNGNIAVSDLRQFVKVTAPDVTLKGFEVIRFSDTPDDYSVVSFNGAADNSLMDNMYISDSAFMAAEYSPSSDTNTGSTIQDSTIRYSNYMGVSANQTTSFTIKHSNISHMDQFDEFTTSPQSGSLKTSRTWYTKVLNSKITDDKSQGLWFDQSNYKVTVAGNDIENITGTALFFEISDYLYAVNNYIKISGSSVTLRAPGSSDLYLVNNTIVGGQPLVVATDSRSVAGCSDPSHPVCDHSISSDQDHNAAHPHPATLTWMPSINLMLNNIIAYPTGDICYGGTLADFCITQHHSSGATVPINDIIHPADSANDVPQTLIDGNVYANGSGHIIEVGGTTGSRTYYDSGSAFASAMAGSPVNISGFEVHGYTGNQYVNSDGSGTSTLQGLEDNAAAVPTNSAINPYVAAGTKHYGVTWQ